MNLHLPRTHRLALVAFVVVGSAIFLVLLARFGGPTIRLSEPYALTATFRDTQGLAVRSDVLVRGVRAGQVDAIERRGDTAVLRLRINADGVTVRRGATVRTGQKTLLGEAYVDLDPGPAGAPALPKDSELPPSATLDSVELDEALEALDQNARDDLSATVREAGAGARDARTAERVSGTVGELRATVREVRRLGATLRNQDADVAGAVRDGRAVLEEAAGRDATLRALVADAATTLDALTANDRALRATAREVPATLAETRGTLDEALPLLREARPVAADLRSASAPLASALRAAPAAARDLDAVLRRSRSLRRAAEPALRRLRRIVPAARFVARGLDPVLGDLVPVVGYLGSREKTIAAWFSNTADLGLNGDAKGSWARFFIFADPSSAIGAPTSLRANSYTRPGDAANNQPYRPGDYPKLRRARP